MLIFVCTINHRNMTDAEFSRHIVRRGETMKEGFLPELWDGKTPVWRALDGRYDQVRVKHPCEGTG